MNKKKILNDPVYGFIQINSELIFDLIEHPYFQRLRRIRQLGLTDFVYPGALHTRFHHAIGAMHLMGEALDSLRSKGTEITEEEFEAAQIAILLHDIGHGPFSHALEFQLVNNVGHETLTVILMEAINNEFGGALQMAIDIFKNKYPRVFFHQLVSSQLDMDRLDYLQRDSFFTGVSEGTIGANRIIKLLDVVDDQIVVEEKGIYSVENFLVARRLMYWQVYLHKTTLSAEKMIIQLIQRAKDLTANGNKLKSTPALSYFLNSGETDLLAEKHFIKNYCQLDDFDIWAAIKNWSHHDDWVLSQISKMFLDRKLYKVKLSSKPFNEQDLEKRREKLMKLGIDDAHLSYFLVSGEITNAAYLAGDMNILIKQKSGKITDVAEASDLPNIHAMSKIVKKYYLSFPKKLSL